MVVDFDIEGLPLRKLDGEPALLVGDDKLLFTSSNVGIGDIAAHM